MRKPTRTRDLRSFGFTVGSVLAIVAFWPVLLRGEDARLWALIASACLVLPAAAYPRALELPFRGWMAVGAVLGWINTRVILGALFYTLFLLAGLTARLLGKDPMRRQSEPSATTYRILRTGRPVTHMKRQF